MTPDELKRLAREASKKEYESIMAKMKEAAKEGSFSCTFNDISDGAKEQLREAGFTVVKRYKSVRNPFGSQGSDYYEVSFSDKK